MSADVGHGRAVDAGDVGAFVVDDVRVDDQDLADTEAHQLLERGGSGAASADDADPEVAEHALAGGTERSDLPVEHDAESVVAVRKQQVPAVADDTYCADWDGCVRARKHADDRVGSDHEPTRAQRHDDVTIGRVSSGALGEQQDAVGAGHGAQLTHYGVELWVPELESSGDC